MLGIEGGIGDERPEMGLCMRGLLTARRSPIVAIAHASAIVYLAK